MDVKLLFELFEQFEYQFGSDGGKMLLMKILIFIYRILSSLGIQFHAPVVISVRDEASAKALIRELQGLIPVAEVKVNCTDAEFAREFAKYNEEAIVVTGVETKTKYENLKRFADLCRDDEYRGTKFDDPVFVVCVGEIPMTVNDICIGKIKLADSNLHLAEIRNERWETFTRYLITEIQKHFPIIEWELSQLKKAFLKKEDASENEEMAVWYAVERLMRVLIEGATEPQGSFLMEKISNTICEIEEHWLLDPVEGQFDEMFRTYLYREDIRRVVDIKKVTDEDIKYINETVFFDSEYYFIAEPLFITVSKPLEGVIGKNELKANLAEAGMLMRYGIEKPKYTSHQTMMTTEGQVTSPRLMKLRRKKIDRFGRIKLADVIAARGAR